MWVAKDFRITHEAHKLMRKHVLKYYWATKHVMCQKYLSEKPSESQVKFMKKLAKKYGFRDFRQANVRVDKRGIPKAIDVGKQEATYTHAT